MVQTAGNLATSQSVINLLQQRIRRDGASLLNVPSVYDATALIAETTREVMARDGGNLAGNTDLSCSFLVGGQIAGGPPALYSIYPRATSSRPRRTRLSCNWAKASTASRSSTAT